MIVVPCKEYRTKEKPAIPADSRAIAVLSHPEYLRPALRRGAAGHKAISSDRFPDPRVLAHWGEV